MALIDVIQWESSNRELVYRFPSDDLRLGTQLVVHPGQTAFFVKGGQIADCFESGTYTLHTSNLPLLNKLINLPFGNKSPFKAEVWFINQLSILDSKWGTPSPIQLEDPLYGVIVPVRAFGQYGIRVSQPRLFLETLVGNQTAFSLQKVDMYFKGKMMASLSNILSTKISQDRISILSINSHLLDMSSYIRQQLDSEFDKYGLRLESFEIMSVNVPEDDPSFQKLKEAKDMAARIKITGRDIYQMQRSFDVMEKAASNEGGNVGSMMGVGMGLGAGVNIGNQMGNMAAQTLQVAPPPLSQATAYYVAVNGQQSGPYDLLTIQTFIDSGQINAQTMVWKAGMPAWAPASTLMELAPRFGACPPPVPPAL